MLEWNEYLKTVLESKTILDNITLSFNERTLIISPIVKASTLMLEDMVNSQGNYNIFVFPEVEQYAKEFLLAKVIYNISSGKVHMQYDPDKFKKGQILKYKGCTVKFDCIKKVGDTTRIYVKFADRMRYALPIDIAPLFQITEAKRLSTYERFLRVYSTTDAISALSSPSNDKNLINKIENHKTHLDGSIFFVSEIKANREFLLNALLDYKKVSDVLYLAQSNGDGKISNLSAGQLTGNPAIILASDLYSVINALSNGVTIQSIIFDISQPNAIDKQLDAIDVLGQYDFSIACITDTINSFDLFPLCERGYNLWRWDSDSITDELIIKDESTANRKTRNCRDQNVTYISVFDEKISKVVKLLYKQKSNIEDQSPVILALYEKMFSAAFILLRNIIPLDDIEKVMLDKLITDCAADLENEKRFIGTEMYSELLQAVLALKEVLSENKIYEKHEVVFETLLNEKYNSVCIVIPERLDRAKYESYWNSIGIPTDIRVMYPMEHEESQDKMFDIVIIVGWLSNKIMRNIIYGYSAKEYLVLTYPCEERWKKAHTRTWKKALSNSGNGEIVKRSFNRQGITISSHRFENTREDVSETIPDELDDIEQVIRISKYKRYNSSSYSSEVVDAFPVSFVGGLLAFYKSGHKIVDATEIISGSGDKIVLKTSDKLKVGDFVVIREAERDIIRDIADKILEKSRQADLRQLSSKWKESLTVEALFSSYDEIYKKLCQNGCRKDFTTVKNWITNDDLIQPNDIGDMICIATATEDEVLLDNIEKIYEAGKEVRRAHVQAGRILSQRLKNKIAEHIQLLGTIDMFNVWDPITFHLEDIGLVKILKVIDVGGIITIDSSNTNRLILG